MLAPFGGAGYFTSCSNPNTSSTVPPIPINTTASPFTPARYVAKLPLNTMHIMPIASIIVALTIFPFSFLLAFAIKKLFDYGGFAPKPNF